MWAVREAFVAICTTNMPPVVPLLRVWLSPCLGRTDTTTDNSNRTQTTKGSRYSNALKRSASKASRKSQIAHNQTMSDRYFADLEAPTAVTRRGTGDTEIKLETYSASRGSSKASNRPADDMLALRGVEKPGLALTTKERDVDENVVQTAREMV